MVELRFTNDWFKKGIQPIWERNLLPWLKEHQGLSYLELGVCEGQSMLWILEHGLPRDAVGVDRWEPPRKNQAAAFEIYRRNCEANLEPFMRHNRMPVRLVEEDTFAWLARQIAQGQRRRYDLIYVDADHRGVEALQDIVLAWKLLKLDGWLVIDDLQRVWHKQPLVRFAQRAFDDVYQGRYEQAWREGRQICYEKRKD